MIDSRDARKILDALAKKLGVDMLGAHSYDGVELLCRGYDKKLSREVELMRSERLWKKNEVHQAGWYELPLPKEFETKLRDSAVSFKLYQFLKLEDIAYHLKMHLADVEAAVARTLLKQALGEGIHVEKRDGKSGLDVKLGSLEELQVLSDLLG